MAYRLTRNIERSLIDYIAAQLTSDSWVGISVEKSTANISKKIPCIAVQALGKKPIKREIGGSVYLKYVNVNLRIFANDDGQRLDLADWLLEKLESNINYYIYTISSGHIQSKVLSGNLFITNMLKDEKELANTNPELLDKEDRYRHIISFECYAAQ